MERPAQGKHHAPVGGTGEPIQRERRPERIAQQMFEPFAVALVNVGAGVKRDAARGPPGAPRCRSSFERNTTGKTSAFARERDEERVPAGLANAAHEALAEDPA